MHYIIAKTLFSRAFKNAECPILVATALSARGLDIPNLMHVVNYDLPRHGGINEYIHRIGMCTTPLGIDTHTSFRVSIMTFSIYAGRTARIGNEGLATSFYTDKDEDIAFDLVKILLECNQPVPDFLEDYLPAEGNPDFADDNTDKEDEDEDEHEDEHEDEQKNHEEEVGGNECENEDNGKVIDNEDEYEKRLTNEIDVSWGQHSGLRNTGLGESQWAVADVAL
jgi:ATP-dependent RNA helicase DDX3X